MLIFDMKKIIFLLFTLILLGSCSNSKRVIIKSIEGSKIHINENNYVTEADIELDMDNEYNLQIECDGYHDYQTTLRIDETTEEEINIPLKVKLITLEFNIEPSRVKARLNGKSIKKFEYEPGEYELVVSKKGYTSYIENFTLEVGSKTKVFNIKLKRDPSDIVLQYVNTGDYDSLDKLESNSEYRTGYIYKDKSPLFLAIENRDFDMVKYLLMNNFAQTYGTGIYDGVVSCLLEPIKNNDLEMVSFLLENGFGKNLSHEMGTTYDLQYALEKSSVEMVRLLLENNYNVNEKIKRRSNGEASGGISNLLHFTKDIEIISLLIEYGININFISMSNYNNLVASYTALDKISDSKVRQIIKDNGGKNIRDLSIEELKSNIIGYNGIIKTKEKSIYKTVSNSSEIISTVSENEKILILATDITKISDRIPHDYWMLIKTEDDVYGWIRGQDVYISGFNSNLSN